MATTLRIATFNLEELDYPSSDKKPPFSVRRDVLQTQLVRLRADILCLQEVSSQGAQGQPRQLAALADLIQGTDYENFQQAVTRNPGTNELYPDRNLVVLSRFPIAASDSVLNGKIAAPEYKLLTASPPQAGATPVCWDRPILHAKIDLPGSRVLHVFNLHLKSKLPTTVPGQKTKHDKYYIWETVTGWAEGFFLSSIKRVGQALEARCLIDELFDQDGQAWICACGDFNADTDEVPVLAIRGDVENTDNPAHIPRVMVPCERTIPEPARFSLIHHGQGCMLDHLLVSRPMLAFYRRSEIHNELLHDESVAYAFEVNFPESDHAPVVAEFEIP